MKSIILTEGGKGIGFGHITRCLSLYQGCKINNVDVKMIINGDETILNIVNDIDYQLFDWVNNESELDIVLKDIDFVFIDSYLATKNLYDKISNPVIIDDWNRIQYSKGIVINPSIFGDKLFYPDNTDIDYLLGKEYIILRKEFWSIPNKIINQKAKQILITSGGVSCGLFIEELTKVLHDNFDLNVEIIDPVKKRLNAQEMIDLMLESDLCITFGGQTTYELARIGIPSIGISFVENQISNLIGWEEKGFLDYIGWIDDSDLIQNIIKTVGSLQSYEERLKRSINGKKHSDGQGVNRIINFILRKYNV